MKISKDYLETAVELADIAGHLMRLYFRNLDGFSKKGDGTPLTEADKRIEEELRELIKSRHPSHGISGEEFDDFNIDSEWVWTIDPIDGTKGFITGKPLCGTLIGLCFKRKPFYGIIDHALLGERWQGGLDADCLFNGSNVSTRRLADINKAQLYASSPYMFISDYELRGFDNLRRGVNYTNFGADCYAYGLLASGFIDVIAEADMKPSDYASLVPVIMSAGGIISDWQGNSLPLKPRFERAQVLACGDERIHKQALALLNRDS